MSVKTQGSQLYGLFPDPATPGKFKVMEVECITDFNGGGNPADQIEDSCLSETSRKYKRGMRTPSQATFNVSADPENESHVALYEAAEDDSGAYDDIKWALGWSDGKDIAPTLNLAGDDFELPATRTWFLFSGYVTDFPFDFQANTVVKTACAIQRSGRGFWVRKTA